MIRIIIILLLGFLACILAATIAYYAQIPPEFMGILCIAIGVAISYFII